MTTETPFQTGYRMGYNDRATYGDRHGKSIPANPEAARGYHAGWAAQDRMRALPLKKQIKVKLCEECGKYPADFPSRICCGCDAYHEHTAIA